MNRTKYRCGWLRFWSAGSGPEFPKKDAALYAGWADNQITLRIRRTRWTYGGQVGIGWSPFRIWVRMDQTQTTSKYA